MTDLAETQQAKRAVLASASRFDCAWGVVVGAGLLMFVNLGPVLYYTSGIFTKAITDDTGWTRGTIAAASLPANLLITLTLPLVGWAVDAYGTRRIALLSSILFRSTAFPLERSTVTTSCWFGPICMLFGAATQFLQTIARSP